MLCTGVVCVVVAAAFTSTIVAVVFWMEPLWQAHLRRHPSCRKSKQMQVEMLGWNVRQIPLPLSEEKYFVCADWVKESVSTEEILKTVGASEQDLREIEALSTLVVPESVEKVFSTLIGDASPSRKNRGLGRNQKCSCGSGKKVKHCCGTR